MKSVFGQVCAKMSTFGTDSLMLPHRVWKVKFIGEMGLIILPFSEREKPRRAIVHLYWSESESGIAFRWIHRESNLMFSLSSDKYLRNKNAVQ